VHGSYICVCEMQIYVNVVNFLCLSISLDTLSLDSVFKVAVDIAGKHSKCLI